MKILKYMIEYVVAWYAYCATLMYMLKSHFSTFLVVQTTNT